MSNKPAIPSWQRAQTAAPATAPAVATSTPPEQEASSEQLPEPSPAPGTDEPTEDGNHDQKAEGTTLLEQASRFLTDPAIRDAPREKKAAFLESKGVKPEEIDNLLDAPAPRDIEPDIAEAGEQAWSTAPPVPTLPPIPQSQARDIPPIVTYPEFLAQPTHNPPLITTSRLLNTAYITGALAATMYGLSKYIVAPMSQNMTESRHDFATHTQEQLEELNRRLKDAVSVDPTTNSKSKASDLADDVSEADSDPTELFHRDFGTQTSPSLSRRPSLSPSAAEESAVTSHENRLKILTSHIRELEATRSNDTASSQSLKTKLTDLTTYLSEMSYQNQYFGMGGFYGGSYGVPKTKDGKDDQIEVLKGDIRAVKGVFLSARNFPTGGRNTASFGRVGG